MISKIAMPFNTKIESQAHGNEQAIYINIQNIITKITDTRKSKLISDAIEFAIKAHEGQLRKGTSIPYVIHPLRVGLILSELGCSDEVVIAGVLHDTIEDTGTTHEEIEQLFGSNVAFLVQGASEPDKSDTWENRKTHTIEYLKTAPKDVLFVSCADKIDNNRETDRHLLEVGEEHWKAFKRPREQQKWYYESLAKVFISRIDDDVTNKLFKQFEQELKNVYG